MKKKVISAMLAAAMIISVTGCGNNGGTESAKDTTASGTCLLYTSPSPRD